MAGKERGKNVLLKVDTGVSPTVFAALAGQKTCTLSINGSEIDTSDKTTDGWATSLAGLNKMTVDVSGVAVWPDSSGLELIRAAASADADADKIIAARAVLNAAGAYYQANWVITNFSIEGPFDGVTSYSFTMSITEAPTYAASGG